MPEDIERWTASRGPAAAVVAYFPDTDVASRVLSCGRILWRTVDGTDQREEAMLLPELSEEQEDALYDWSQVWWRRTTHELPEPEPACLRTLREMFEQRRPTSPQ